MTAGPRVLAIMGSGETAPAMGKVHRALFDRFDVAPVPAAILDTPYGFQENADELSARTAAFFATTVGNPVQVASYRSRDVDAVTAATALARIREARYVMAGPGSPSYALREWAAGPIPGALAEKLAAGGVLVLASAAALTAGIVTIPVYEIYKVGEAPRWLDGLDLLGAATGLRAAVVPHYDNAEGGNHDTRFCYMGERRLRMLEAMSPEAVFILGVDSHTAMVLDLEAGTASVVGLGGVTVRVDARSIRFETGSEIPIEAIADAARGLRAGPPPRLRETAVATAGERPPVVHPAGLLRDEVAELEGSFVAALDGGGVRDAVAALLDLDTAIEARTRSGEDSPDLDNAGAVFRALIVRLGERAEGDARDGGAALKPVLGPLVDALLAVRAAARTAGDWATADRIRDQLATAGVELRDGPEGVTWLLAGAPGSGSERGSPPTA